MQRRCARGWMGGFTGAEKSRECSAGVRVGWWVGSQVLLGLPASAMGSQSAPLPMERTPRGAPADGADN